MLPHIKARINEKIDELIACELKNMKIPIDGDLPEVEVVSEELEIDIDWNYGNGPRVDFPLVPADKAPQAIAPDSLRVLVLDAVSTLIVSKARLVIAIRIPDMEILRIVRARLLKPWIYCSAAALWTVNDSRESISTGNHW